MKFVISALFIFNFGCFSFCRSFTVLILNNLFFNLELLEMFLVDKDLGQSKSQFLGTYRHHQSTVEKGQSFDWKPVSQIFGAYIVIQIHQIHWICFSHLFGTFVWLPFLSTWSDPGSHVLLEMHLLVVRNSFGWGIVFLPGCVDRWKWHDRFLCWILSQSSRTFHLSGSPGCKHFLKRRPFDMTFFKQECIVFT